MARGRMLSRDASIDPDLNALSMEGELMYLLTIPHLDRDGLVAGDPVLVWAQATPKRLELLDQAPRLIGEWLERGLVVRYAWKDGPVLWFPGFRKHNPHMDYAREPESRFPPPPGMTRTADGLVPDDAEEAGRLAECFDVRSRYYQALKAAATEEFGKGSGGRRETLTKSSGGVGEDVARSSGRGSEDVGKSSGGVREDVPKSSGRRSEKIGKGSGAVREDSGRSSPQDSAEDQDQHQHQDQSDDDDARGREARAEPEFDDDDGETSLRRDDAQEGGRKGAGRTGNANGARGRVERDAAMRGLALEIAGEMQEWTGAGRFVDELDADGVLTLLTWLWLWDTVYNQTDPYEMVEVRDRYPKDALRDVGNAVGKIITQTRLGNPAPLAELDRERLAQCLQDRMVDEAARVAVRAAVQARGEADGT